MPQQEDRAEWKARPWAGTIDQLQRAARRCEEKVAASTPFPGDYDPRDSDQPFDGERYEAWKEAEEARQVAVKVIERDGFGRRLTSIEDLDELGSAQLDHVDGIEIEIGSFGRPSARIIVVRDRGLVATLVGPDRSWTAGLRHELEDILAPAGKLRPLPVRTGEGYLGLAVVLFYLLFIGLAMYFNVKTDWSLGLRLGVAAGVAALPAVLVGLAATLPGLELLAPGDRPTYERWRSRALAAAAAIFLGIVASLVAALIDS